MPSNRPVLGTDAARELGRVLLVSENLRADELRALVEADGIVVQGTRDPADAPAVAATFRPSLVLIDGDLPWSARADLPREIRASCGCPSALLLHSTSGEAVTEALRCDADTVMGWPLDLVGLRRLLSQQGAACGATGQTGQTGQTVDLPSCVVGGSAQMREVWRRVFLLARNDGSILIQGETGTGKEVVAQALHRFSGRRFAPFVAVNCAALPETLLESELFGHEKGAFTGAASRHRGRFELADRGTLFLDEIGDMPLPLQVKLLRVLQERTLERVGGSEGVSIDVRVIAATHGDLAQQVQRGRFRPDLFYRLSVLPISVPPLRQRKGDILAFWERFLEEGAARDARPVPRAQTAVQRILLRHDWRGNVRELQNAAQHALAIATADRITPADLPAYLSEHAVLHAAPDLVGLTLKEAERAVILQTYQALGTVDATAEMLRISARKIHYRLKEYKQQHLLYSAARTPSGAEPDDMLGPPPVGTSRSVVRVLLAEDDDELRWALEECLTREGYEVIAVPDGNAVLNHLGAALLLEQREAPPDVIITDLRLPGVTGMHLLEAIHGKGWTVPVVVISAFGDERTRARARKLGATAFLDKPFDTEDLKAVIQEALASGREEEPVANPERDAGQR
jgi:DNA-binding NtrC family response regulator